MLLLILNVLFVLIAIAMVALILMQRGAGAQAGSGFGGGASATVFGARGSSNFLSKATKWLAIAFFAITMFMAWQATRSASPGPVQQDLGVMSQLPEAPAKAPAAGERIPTAPAQGAPAPDIPSAPAQPASGSATPPTQTPQPQPEPRPVPQGG